MSAHAQTTRASSRRGPLLVLRRVDLFCLCFPLVFGIATLALTDQPRATLPMFGIALIGLLARFWDSNHAHPFARAAGNLYFIPIIGAVYGQLNPLVDALSPAPYDRDLQAIDQWLFGLQPSVWLQKIHHPTLTEILLICYAAFFAWQLILGVLLYFKGRKQTFESYVLAVMLFYAMSDVMYVLIPAIGPRFDQVALFTVELGGLWLAGPLIQSFFEVPMLRDCFPSGHTGLTLLVLYFAYSRGERRFFSVMLPFGLLLIFSTLYGRFHYAIDLLCALPFLVSVLMVHTALGRLLPDRIVVPILPQLDWPFGAPLPPSADTHTVTTAPESRVDSHAPQLMPKPVRRTVSHRRPQTHSQGRA